MEFIGSADNTPVLNNMRVYYPRISYLRYLPAIYQKNEKSMDFLERFLSIFESVLMDMEYKIDNISQYFDPDYVNGDFLRWLLSWMKIIPSDGWREEDLKALLKKSSELYKKRGTRQGLENMLEIFTGYKPYIIEYPQLRTMIRNPDLSKMVYKLYEVTNYSFCVLVDAKCIRDSKHFLEIEKIVNDEKPAFTEVKIVTLQHRVCLDLHSYLEINSYLSKTSQLRLDKSTTISQDIYLEDQSENERRKKVKVGVDSKLT